MFLYVYFCLSDYNYSVFVFLHVLLYVFCILNVLLHKMVLIYMLNKIFLDAKLPITATKKNPKPNSIPFNRYH